MVINERANRCCKLALELFDRSKYAKVIEKLPKDKDFEIEVTRLRRKRTGTEPIVFGTNRQRKVPQRLEKIPGAIKFNVLHKIALLRADNENISVH